MRRSQEGFSEGVLQWAFEGGRVLRRVLRRHSKKEHTKQKHAFFSESTTPFTCARFYLGDYGPLERYMREIGTIWHIGGLTGSRSLEWARCARFPR